MGPASDNAGYAALFRRFLRRIGGASMPSRRPAWTPGCCFAASSAALAGLQWVQRLITLVMRLGVGCALLHAAASMGPASDNAGYDMNALASDYKLVELQWVQRLITLVMVTVPVISARGRTASMGPAS